MKRLHDILSRAEPAKWLFYGDSITHGAAHTFGRRDYTEHFGERLRWELGRPLDVVLNTAISGNTSRELLQTFDWRVGQFWPDVVFVMIGMNDCNETKKLSLDEFRRNLKSLTEKIVAMGAIPILQTTCPILPGSMPDREALLDQYMEIVRELAAGEGHPLIDHSAQWKQNIARIPFWMSNQFHPNEFGHIAFSHLLFRELNIFDSESRTCRLFFP